MNKFTANRKCHDYERKSEYGLLKMYENDLRPENSKLLTKEEEMDLFYKYRENHDKEAYEKLIYCNTRLVISIAKEYAKFNTDFKNFNMSFLYRVEILVSFICFFQLS